MKKIDVDINFRNKLGISDFVKMFIDRIRPKVEKEKEIELNLENCVTDYTDTSELIDYLLDSLTKHEGKKQLYIKMNGLGRQIFIYYQLFLGSEFFQIKEKIAEVNLVEWDKIISDKLILQDIVIKIEHTPTETIWTLPI